MNWVTVLINPLHRANSIVAQVEAKSAIGSSHHFTKGSPIYFTECGDFFALAHIFHPKLVMLG